MFLKSFLPDRGTSFNNTGPPIIQAASLMVNYYRHSWVSSICSSDFQFSSHNRRSRSCWMQIGTFPELCTWHSQSLTLGNYLVLIFFFLFETLKFSVALSGISWHTKSLYMSFCENIQSAYALLKIPKKRTFLEFRALVVLLKDIRGRV